MLRQFVGLAQAVIVMVPANFVPAFGRRMRQLDAAVTIGTDAEVPPERRLKGGAQLQERTEK